jgi:hypothetical protein
MTFINAKHGINVTIEVQNIGITSTRSAAGTISFSNYVQPATLSSQRGSYVAPGEKGSIAVFLPHSVAVRCRTHTVVLDIDRTWQFDTFGGNVFGNDRADLAAPCLTWTTPITESNLGSKPDPWLYNKSLESIVGSFERGSPLGFCSHCHYQGSRPYSPDVLQDDEGWISDRLVIDGWRWSGPLGWALWFVDPETDKPESIKRPFREWIANGYPR